MPSDLTALAAQVAANPTDTTVRGAYADLLDELSDSGMPCPKCGGTRFIKTHDTVYDMVGEESCHHCTAGSVPDDYARRAALERIRAEPHLDKHRIDFAAVLEGESTIPPLSCGDYSCIKCGFDCEGGLCPACGGESPVRGRLVIPGREADAARAEFVRVQVELANHGWHPDRRKSPSWACFCASVKPGHNCSECLAKAKDWIELVRRERSLWKTLWSESAGWLDPAWKVYGWSETPPSVAIRVPDGTVLTECEFRRGLLAELRIPRMVDLVGERCACGLSSNPKVRPNCRLCSGTGRTPGLAAALSRTEVCAGVEKIVVADREPTEWATQDDGLNWVWTVSIVDLIETLSDLPRFIFGLLTGGALNKDNWNRRYPTRDLAVSALASAAAAYIRAWKA